MDGLRRRSNSRVLPWNWLASSSAKSDLTNRMGRDTVRNPFGNITQNKYYVGEKKEPGATTCFDTGNTV